MRVFVCRNAFGRTRKRRPQSSSSIASSPQSRVVGRFVTSAGVSFTAQWIERTSGKRRSTSTNSSRSKRSPAAVTSWTSSWPVFRPSRSDEVAEVAGVLGLVVGLEPLRPRPVARRRSRIALPRSVVSQHFSMSSTSSQRPALWKPSAGPAGVCVNEYSSLLR